MPVQERQSGARPARDRSRCRAMRRLASTGASVTAWSWSVELVMRVLLRQGGRADRAAPSSMSAMMLPTISVADEHQHEGRGDIDVADPHRADDRRADGRQREDDRHLDLAGQHVGQHDALIHDERMQRVGHGVPHDHGAFGQALGARRLDILRVQRIEQIPAHHAHVVGEAAEGGDGDHRPDVLHEIDELVPGPGRAAIAGGEEAADLLTLNWKTRT